MPRRITVECKSGHREEITIGSNDRIPRCKRETIYSKYCRKAREIVWEPSAVAGFTSPGFRIKGLTKNFRK